MVIEPICGVGSGSWLNGFGPRNPRFLGATRIGPKNWLEKTGGQRWAGGAREENDTGGEQLVETGRNHLDLAGSPSNGDRGPYAGCFGYA